MQRHKVGQSDHEAMGKSSHAREKYKRRIVCFKSVDGYIEGQKALHCVFVDLEKAYDKVPREEVWYCMRKSGVAKKFVIIVQGVQY